MAYNKKTTTTKKTQTTTQPKKGEKEFAQGIYIKRMENEKVDLISVVIRRPDESGYDKYVFYPKKEQKDDRYIEYYGLVDNYGKENE